MDYTALAYDLLDIRCQMLPMPADQQLSRMLKGELFVLNYLVTHEGIVHPKELSQKMAVSTARIASLLNHMEEKGFVRRHPDPEDNRQVFVELTEDGREALLKIKTAVIGHLAQMLEALGPEDAANYIRIQKKIWSGYLQKTEHKL